jgi:hypothetical protein
MTRTAAAMAAMMRPIVVPDSPELVRCLPATVVVVVELLEVVVGRVVVVVGAVVVVVEMVVEVEGAEVGGAVVLEGTVVVVVVVTCRPGEVATSAMTMPTLSTNPDAFFIGNIFAAAKA